MRLNGVMRKFEKTGLMRNVLLIYVEDLFKMKQIR